MERAKLLFGSYRKGQADDPEIYVASITAVLSEYPPDVVAFVTDPRTGIQKRNKWLPDVPEVVAACEEAMAPRYRSQREYEQAQQRQQDREADARRAAQPRPTLSELQAKYGPGWGLKASEPEHDEQKLRRADAMQRANRVTFERECEAAGMPKNSTVSPTLYRLLHGGDEAAPDVQEHAA